MRYARLFERFKRIAAALARREPASIVLRRERTPTDLREVTARLDSDGGLIVEGHDFGKGVESPLSYPEYEWTVTIAATEIPKLAAALKARRGLLRALQRRFSGDKSGELEGFLKGNGIAYSFWNRIGD